VTFGPSSLNHRKEEPAMRLSHPLRRFRVASSGLLVLLSAVPAGKAASPDAPPTQPARDTITDAQVAGVVLTATASNIARYQLVLSRSADPTVRSYAQAAAQDYTVFERRTLELLKRLEVQPAESAPSEHLEGRASEVVEGLAAEDGEGFDTDFIAGEVVSHRDLLHTIDSVLLPSVDERRMEKLLQSFRPVVEAHLAHAERVATSLTG
jgi:putative membrane protein